MWIFLTCIIFIITDVPLIYAEQMKNDTPQFENKITRVAFPPKVHCPSLALSDICNQDFHKQGLNKNIWETKCIKLWSGQYKPSINVSYMFLSFNADQTFALKRNTFHYDVTCILLCPLVKSFGKCTERKDNFQNKF